MPETFEYAAFLSYSHKDKKLGAWLHRQLENYRIPANLVGKTTDAGTVPARIGRVFRDRDELPATDNLNAEVQKALESSRCMVVLCSPSSAASRWVNKEVIEFKKLRGERYVLPIIIDGEPFASRGPNPKNECFPPGIRYKLGPKGILSNIAAEPAAADLRKEADGKRRAVLKLVAGMVGVGLDQLVERDIRRRHQRVMLVTAASVAAMIAMSALTYEAVTARRDADRNRGEAEDLIQFMLTDLREQLRPVGRLDVLGSVGDKVVSYYQKQAQFGVVPDDSLGRRAQAYHLLGEVEFFGDDLSAAIDLFKQSMAATEELLARDPKNAQRIFEHAQSVFWVGYMALKRRDTELVTEMWWEYKRLSDILMEMEPDNVEWWIEVAYANTNIGQLYLEAYNQPRKALPYFHSGLEKFQEAFAAAPKRTFLHEAIALGHSWLVFTHRNFGHVDDVKKHIALQRDIANSLLAENSKNQTAKTRLMIGHLEEAFMYEDLGNLDAAINQYSNAVNIAEELFTLDSKNFYITHTKASSWVHLADIMISKRQYSQAHEYLQKAEAFAAPHFSSDKAGLRPWWLEFQYFAVATKLRLTVSEKGIQYVQPQLIQAYKDIRLHSEGLQKTQFGKQALALVYKLKLQYLQVVNDTEGINKLIDEIWPLIEGDNRDQSPMILWLANDIAVMTGDHETSKDIRRVLIERGYPSNYQPTQGELQ